MKKILSLGLFFIALIALSACNGNALGEFPEVNENKEVDMTAEEMNTLLSTVTMETQMEEAMLLTIDLDMNLEEEYINPFTMIKEFDSTMDLELSSKTYLSLSEDFDKIVMISNNTIDMNSTTDYVSTAMTDEEESIQGDLDVYFKNQFIYYNADLTSLEEDSLISNGKYKMNLGFIQSMWSELFTSPEDLVDDYLDIGINPDELLDSVEMMTYLIESGMISTYKDGSTYTFRIDITKAKLLSNLNSLLDATMDTTDWDEIDYFEYASEIQESINMFDQLEVSMVYVLEDDAIQKFGIEMNIEMNQDGAMIKVSGQIVVDINVELPKFPSDLDEYEALEVPLFGF